MIAGLISLAIAILIVGLIAGMIVFLIRRAPFIQEPFRQWSEYLVVTIAVLIVILQALRFLGVAT